MAHTPTPLKTQTLTIFQRITKKDRAAVKDCMDTYGNFIWALARKFTSSDEEAKAATQEIFIDIWRYAERGVATNSAENILIAQIARRRLVKYLTNSQTKSMENIDTKNEQG